MKILTRRSFLRGLAVGAAAAPVAAAARNLFAQPAAPSTALCYSTKRLPTAADLRWLGAFRVPRELGDKGVNPEGTLAGRYVGNSLRFFMQASKMDGSQVIEFEYPGQGDTLATAPLAPISRIWGDVYGGLRLGLSRQPIDNSQDTQIYWDEDSQALYWSYMDAYNVTAVNNPVVGCARLDGTSGAVQAFGPWQFDLPPHQTHRGFVRIPLEFAAQYLSGRTLAIGGIGTSSGNASSSWGPVLASVQADIGPGTAAFPARGAIGTKRLVGYSITNRARRDSNYVVHTAPDMPGGYWTQMDGYGGTCCWVETEALSGLMFFQMRATGHVWYGVSTDCGHGLADTGAPGTTGPHCTSSKPMAYVYSPEDLGAVAKGDKRSYEIAASEIDLTPMGIWKPTYPQTNGAFFDQRTKRLFLSCMGGESPAPWQVYPVINVYQLV